MSLFCSIIIPTVGRSTLGRAVKSALDQKFDRSELEIIVVNDSGQLLSEEQLPVTDRVLLLNTFRCERSFARNCGAAAARGRYLCFLDDDDWLLPDALACFKAMALSSPKAAWLYGGIQIADEPGSILPELNSGLKGPCLAQVLGGAWVPLQSSLIRAADFFEVGGFNPRVQGTEDQDLCRRIAVRGEFANSPKTVACLFRGEGWQTTTDYGRAAEDTRWSREEIVNQPGVFYRLTRSPRHPYWFGRIVHVYLGLSHWHLRNNRLSKFLGRSLQGAAALVLSANYLTSKDFWKALCDHHVPGSLHFVQQNWEQNKSAIRIQQAGPSPMNSSAFSNETTAS